MCPPREKFVVPSCKSNLWRPWEKSDLEKSHNAPLNSRHPSSLKCTICSRSYKRDSELRRHRISKHLRKRETCRYCGKHFTRKDNLTRHIKLAHISKRKPSCRFCSKSLSRRDAVQRHESRCPKNPSKALDLKFVPEEIPVTTDDFPTHMERMSRKHPKLSASTSDEDYSDNNDYND